VGRYYFSALPYRQLRKRIAERIDIARRALPYRQLRNGFASHAVAVACALPYRQLRNCDVKKPALGGLCTAVQAA